MSVIGLTQEHNTGIAELDRHHAELLEIARRLHDSVQAEESEAKIDALLEELIERTRAHFEYEEALMKSYGFPDLEAHKAEHDELLSCLAGLRDARGDGCHPRFEEEIDASDDWTLIHVREKDVPLGAFLRSKGLR
jgi:hemerythrin-like metal-binding protein